MSYRLGVSSFPMAPNTLPCGLCSCHSSTSGTFAANCVPVKQAVKSEFPKSTVFSNNQRVTAIKQGTQHKYKLLVRASYSEKRSGGGDFFAGFVLGGAIFGTLGYLFAPQINKLVSAVEREIDESSRRLPKGFDDDEEGLARTRRNLNAKIAQLNAAIDSVSAQLRADNQSDGEPESTGVEFETAA
ncbi:hypothetical protein KP509_06G005900 [Ceratopteris richardii]|uniref:Uncharacterized protein n=1 Tax=Ceratopteris richardii TaxID=49495 RepID=A0A8T2UDY7_CERRI|nr:hypothetical protein KP509_06G005900 [Ceratopteris richardii]